MKDLFKKDAVKLLTIASVFALLFTSCANKDLKVWVATPWQQVLKNTPPAEVQTVSLKSASNEYEPFRVIIHNSGKKKIDGLNVTVSNLKNETAEIAAENIQLYRANYLNVTKGSYRTKSPAGYYPDALIPFGAVKDTAGVKYVAAPFSVDTASNAEVWCDLYVPSGTKAGKYTGTVTVTRKQSKVAQIPVTVEVWGFELPSTISMQSHFGSLDQTGAKILGVAMGSPEFLELEAIYEKELLKNRAVPSTPASAWPEWNEKDGIIDRGEGEKIKKLIETDHFNVLDIPLRFKDDPKKCKAYLAATAKWLKDLGYLDRAYVYMEDEPNDAKEYEIVRTQGKMIKAADPEIKRMCTEQTVTSDPKWGTLYGAVDIWCPIWGLWDEKTASERLAAGEKLWSYTALCQGKEGTPWWQVDVDPLNYRSPMWISWHYDISGYLYWHSTCYRGMDTPEAAWTSPYFRNMFWGEGLLLYPGKPAGIKGFVPSERLKLYRESAEDYEYMVLAAKKAGDGEVDNIVNSLVSNWQTWSHDNAAYESAREKLAQITTRN